LSLYWRGNELFFHNFARRLTVSAKPLTCEVLNFFNQWRTLQKACAQFSDYNQASVISNLSRLVKLGLLVSENSDNQRLDDLVGRQWGRWLPEGSFHFSTKDVFYLRGNSKRELKAILPRRPPPKSFKVVKGARKALPQRTIADSEFVRVLLARKTHRRFSQGKLKIEELSQLLSLVWGVTGQANSSEFGKLVYKTSPSGGARHPGEVYIMALRVEGLRPGLYHYHPERHYLKRLRTSVTPEKASLYCARQEHPRDAAALFFMTAIFGRTMWKYRNARAYRVVLLEAGHLCQTFCLVATWLGLAPFCTAAVKDTLIENDLELDGVSESVLYVAGVGLPVTSARAKRRFFRNADRPAGNPSKGAALGRRN
jgi:SagB-type dehydrogenase family enzyme